MFARVTLGAIAGYAIGLVAVAISGAGLSLVWLSQAIIFHFGSELDPKLAVPTALGALAGYCWHLIATESRR